MTGPTGGAGQTPGTPVTGGTGATSAAAGAATGRPAGSPGRAAERAARAAADARSGGTGATAAKGRAAGGPSRAADRAVGSKRPPRLTTLQLKRLDPWTVLKISLIVSVVMFFVWMIAVGVLYLSMGSLDVWSKINSTYNTLVVSADSTETPPDLVTPGAVFGVTAVIGAVNVVLFTALSTIAAFVYNAAAGMAGGMELTLGERD